MLASKLWKCILTNRWFKLWSMSFLHLQTSMHGLQCEATVDKQNVCYPMWRYFGISCFMKVYLQAWVILLSFSNISICFTLPKFLLITMETYAKEIKMKWERGERRREGEEASFWNLGKECKLRNKNEMIRRWREERMGKKKHLFVNVWCQFTLPLSNFFLLCFLSWSNVTLQK